MSGRTGARRTGVCRGPWTWRVRIRRDIRAGDEGSVDGRRGRRQMGTRLEKPEQLFIVAAQPFLLVGLLLHILLKVRVLLRQLSINIGRNSQG